MQRLSNQAMVKSNQAMVKIQELADALEISYKTLQTRMRVRGIAGTKIKGMVMLSDEDAEALSVEKPRGRRSTGEETEEEKDPSPPLATPRQPEKVKSGDAPLPPIELPRQARQPNGGVVLRDPLPSLFLPKK